MSSLIGKRIGGQTYYYLREVARVGGRPKIVSQRYLGKADDIAAAVDGVTVLPERTRHLAFGDVAAAWSVIERLGVAAIIDEVTGSRRADAAAGAGPYLALATLNRVVAPCPELAFADWWATTAADRWVKVPAAALDHRRFWDAMDLVSPAQLDEIERRIGQAVSGQFGLDLPGLGVSDLARGFGCRAVDVTTAEELEQEFKAALSAEITTVIVVRTQPQKAML